MDLALAIEKVRPGSEYRFLDDAPVTIDRVEWRDDRPKPTQAEAEAAWAQIQAEQLESQTKSDSRRSKVAALAAGAIGKKVTDLTAKELQALQFRVLENSGALNDDLSIKPLDQWTR